MRGINRRTFIAASGAAAAGSLLAGCGGGGLAPLADTAGTVPGGAVHPVSEPPSVVADLSFEHFETLVGETFVFENQQGDGGPLELADVTNEEDLANYPPEMAFREPFTLVFHGERDLLPGEGRYDVTHPDFGVFELHIIPRMPEDDLGRYDIILS